MIAFAVACCLFGILMLLAASDYCADWCKRRDAQPDEPDTAEKDLNQ